MKRGTLTSIFGTGESLATSAARAGKTEASIMRHGRWRSERVARRYIRAGQRWDDNAAAGLL